ncbi:MAG: hypothetical protein EOP11_15525 [Proteobacteria bacterium]|nr:MAG: hypothetical protein EOP11_15525 [Pseudomonadota bacterium]
MRCRTLLPLSLLFLAAPASAAPLKILVTSFEAYNGRSVNGSLQVAEALKALSRPGEVEFVTCTLPVEFGVAGKRAIDCFENEEPKPAMVLSLGESPSRACAVSLETRAANLMVDFLDGDAKGVKKAFEKVEEGGPLYEPLTLPVPEMFCTVEAGLNDELEPSASAGEFVCNDVAYQLARYLKPKKIPSGFIHVPAPGRCEEDRPASETAGRLRAMLMAAAQSLNDSNPAFKGTVPIPCDTPEVSAELKALSSFASKSCLAIVKKDIAARAAEENKKIPPLLRAKYKGAKP